MLVFRVSLKATAKKTAQAISTASGKVYNSVVSHKNQRQNDPNYQIYSGNGYDNRRPQNIVPGNNQVPRQQDFIGTTVITYGDNGVIPPSSDLEYPENGSRFVQNGRKIKKGPYTDKQGPFMTNLPIDSQTGFSTADYTLIVGYAKCR